MLLKITRKLLAKNRNLYLLGFYVPFLTQHFLKSSGAVFLGLFEVAEIRVR